MENKYEYYLNTWGGFYNQHNKNIHGFEDGEYYFNSNYERQNYIDKLQKAKTQLTTPDAVMMLHLEEGYTVRSKPILHRIAEYEGERFYSFYEWSFPNEDLYVLNYHMEYKWYPGFNDYVIEETLKKEIDYKKIKIIQEWVTGAFNTKNE